MCKCDYCMHISNPINNTKPKQQTMQEILAQAKAILEQKAKN